MGDRLDVLIDYLGNLGGSEEALVYHKYSLAGSHRNTLVYCLTELCLTQVRSKGTPDDIFQGLAFFDEIVEHPVLSLHMSVTPAWIKSRPLLVNAKMAYHGGAPLQVGFGYLLQPPGPCQPSKGAQGQTLSKADGK